MMKTGLMLVFLVAAMPGYAGLKPAQVQIFKSADVNQDGKVSLEEWMPVLKARFEKQGKEGWEEQAPKQFRNVDKDKDGFLDLNEFWPEQVETPAETAGLLI